MAGAAARPFRSRFPVGAVRGDRAHHAHQPEIFRACGCQRRAGSGLHLRCQPRRHRWRRRHHPRQPARALRPSVRRALLLGTGSGDRPRRRAGSVPAQSERHRVPREVGLAGRQGGSRRGAGQVALRKRRSAGRSGASRTGRAPRQGRSRLRHGWRVPRSAGPDRPLSGARHRRGASHRRRHPRPLQARRAGRRRAHCAGECGSGTCRQA